MHVLNLGSGARWDPHGHSLQVDAHWRLKISDFNLSRILEDTAILSSAQATNPRWLAPEVLEGHPASLKSVSVPGWVGGCGCG
jgi:hypothetical protein